VGATNTKDWNTTSSVRTQARDGYFFQFGRDDPFPVFGSVTITGTLSGVATNVFTTLGTSISTNVFITGSVSTNFDWRQTQLYSTTADINRNIWSTTICTKGYHIPSSAEFTTMYTIN
jgi:hypothetical protein